MDQQKIDRFHRRASDHYMRGEYKKALEAWKRVLELDPLDEKALEGVRLSSLLEGGVDHPLDGDDFGARPLSGDLPDALRRRLDEVDKRIETGDLHEALRAAELLRSERPSDPDVLSALARACLAAGDSDQAAQVTGQLLGLDPAYAEAAQLLEECRQVSPPQSPLGSVVLREAAEARAATAALGVVLEASVPGMESHPFLDDLIAPLSSREGKTTAAPAPADETGLAPVPPLSPAEAADPAMTVLKQRVHDLLRQAKEAAASGRMEEALGLLSRLLILDEQNVEAIALEEQLREETGAIARSTEEWMTEGVQRFDQGQVEAAREFFLRVLEAVPGHREAADYLDRADARLRPQAAPAQPGERARGVPGGPQVRGKAWQAPSVEPAEPFTAIPIAVQPAASVERGMEKKALVLHRPRRRWLSVSVLGVGVVLLATGGILAWRHFAGDDAASPGAAPAPLPPVTQKGTPGATEARPAGAKAAAPAAVERTKSVADAMSRAQAAFDSGRFEAAVLAYNEVLGLDPDHVDARKRLLEAGELYRKSRVEIEKLDRARRAFADGEYDSALGIFYRLPAGLVGPAELNRYKVNGWYNLGLVSLRGANCAQASSQLGEALAIDSSDANVQRARSLAEQCPDRQKDRSYHDTVRNLPFRSLED